MTKRLSGVCYVYINGTQLALKADGSLEYSMASVTRTAELATSGVVGYSETPVAPYISGEFMLTEDFPIDAVTSNTNMTVVAELSNGWTVTLSGAFVDGEITASGSGGTVSLKFVGDKIIMS